MYESPIEVVYGKIQMDFEDNVMKAVQNCEINVNKDALISALMYDRQQYEKGYSEGRKDGKKEILNKLVTILSDYSFKQEITGEEYFMGKGIIKLINIQYFKELFEDSCVECPFYECPDLRNECEKCENNPNRA